MVYASKLGYVGTELASKELRPLVCNQQLGSSVVLDPAPSKGFFHSIRLFIFYGFAHLVSGSPTHYIEKMLLPSKLIKLEEICPDNLVEG